MTAVGFLGLALPPGSRAYRAMAAAAGAFVLVNAAGVAAPVLGPAEALPTVVLTVLLIATFRRRLRRARTPGPVRGATA
ncbi:hypothetical protein C0216_11895 [Streptomyces globosus]|uniref:Uncharacterized protein n=1 Tax=Streptomyces globosus TaxID=68209 RepID=A0A344TZJ3_9ACTN|nr:hypothetical protein [Streptomyces globosus]AXE24064.1 hypothetical protein C0216_11895 [Streptomyces globosus]